MKSQIKRTIAILLTVCFVLSITALTVSAAAGNPNDNVVPVGSTYLGKTYGEWSEVWWKWAESIPKSSNPLLDNTGQFSAEGQSGDVWFLAGTFGQRENVKRECEVPANKALFFPVINVVATQDETLNTEEKMREAAKAAIDTTRLKKVEVDGTKLENLDNFRVGSNLFSFTEVPTDNILGLSGPTPAVSDGYWIMLKPLSEGQHVINIHGNSKLGKGQIFKTEVTYYINVK